MENGPTDELSCESDLQWFSCSLLTGMLPDVETRDHDTICDTPEARVPPRSLSECVCYRVRVIQYLVSQRQRRRDFNSPREVVEMFMTK